MTRLYIQPSWINSAEDHTMWSGGNDQYRGDRSVDVATFDSKGRARMEAFSDSAIESLKKRKTSIPLADRILPQAKRVRLLTEQLYELEAERKNGMDVHTYSQLRDILICKRNRAEELLKKAVSIKPTQPDEDDIDLYTGLPDDTAQVQAVYEVNSNVSPKRESYIGKAVGVVWIDELSHTNSFKSFLQISCKAVRKAVQFKHKAAAYYQTLREV